MDYINLDDWDFGRSKYIVRRCKARRGGGVVRK